MKELSIQEARANAIECINTSEHFVLVSFGSDLDVEVSKAKVIVGEEEIPEKSVVRISANSFVFALRWLPQTISRQNKQRTKMKRLLDNLAGKIYRFAGLDGLLHMVVCAVGATLIYLVIGEALPSAVMMLFIALAKELVIDCVVAGGEFSYKDTACNLIGISIMLLNHI